MPLAALEILAAGVPLVATAVGTLPEILASGGGVTVPVRDDAALAEAILGYLDDPAAAARAGTRAREQIREHHDFHAFVRSFERVFEQALAT
jgi:glycosyltransferase involved in cell wall biosynthesis